MICANRFARIARATQHCHAPAESNILKNGVSGGPGRPPKESRRVPPCAVKACALRPVFARVVKELREMEVQRRRGTASPDPEKIPEPLRGPLGGFAVGILREEKSPKSL